MFGIVEADLNGRKPQQIFSFTKTENTTVTDVHVSQHIFHSLPMAYKTIRTAHPNFLKQEYDHEKAVITIKPMFNDSSMRGIKNAYIQLITRKINIFRNY